jgi:stage II sporulation protein D
MKKSLIILVLMLVPVLTIPVAMRFDKPKLVPNALPNGKSDFEVFKKDVYFKVLDNSNGSILNISAKDFICGVVAAEMPILFETEALRAQAIAAFTYFIRAAKNQRLNPSDDLRGADFVVNSEKWLSYVSKEQIKSKWPDSFDKYYKKLEETLESVLGLTIEQEEEPILATFYAISSGKTERSVDIFGGELPYLTSVPSPGDMLAPGFETRKEVSAEEVKSKIEGKFENVNLPDDKNLWFLVEERTQGGAVKKIKIGTKILSGQEVRNIFSLRSPNFELEYSGEKFIFVVRGYGHGVGMSQLGAQNMAKEGASYEEIIKRYYPGTTIKRR